MKILYAEFPVLLKDEDTKSNVHYSVEGVKGKVKKNIEARIAIFTKFYSKQVTLAEYQAFIEQAPEQITKAMQPYGYYKPVINGSLVNRGTSRMQAVFHIDPGPRMKVTQLNIVIEGPGKEDLKKAVDHFPLKVGDPLLIQKYTEGKQDLMDMASQKGYIRAEMTLNQVKINLENYTSEINIHINTGKCFYFGHVSLTKTPYNEDYLRRYIPFEKGSTFVPNKLTTLQDNLNGSGQFKQIEVFPEYNDVHNQSVPVLVELTPKPSQTYTVGGGYGTDTGIRGTLGWNLLQVTPSGHKFETLIQASEVQNSAQAQYIIPGLNPVTEEYAITGSVYTLDYPDSTSDAAQISGAYRTHKNGYESVYSINQLFEHYTIGDDPSQDARILYPSANWKIRKVSSPVFSPNGYSLSLTTSGSVESVISTVSYAQAEITGKFAKTIKPLHSRIYTRTDLGMTAVNDINNLPPSLQFYTGGSQTVRGYSYQSLGPGKALIDATVEWQQEVVKNGYITFFYDTGNAFNDTPADLVSSVGTGIMWITPIGPLHLSFANALDQDPEDGSPWHIVFSMGPDL